MCPTESQTVNIGEAVFFGLANLLLKQQQLRILLAFDIWDFTMRLYYIFQDFSL